MKIQLEASDLEAIRVIIAEELRKFVQLAEDSQKLYTREELCKKLGIDKSTYHKHINQNKLRVQKIGRKVRLISR